jgi:acyl dehydratase
MTDKRWAYEDFAVGFSIPFGEKLVTAEEIIRFARQFDPQPMHLDEEAGKASILGGLAASGWHTCSMFMRMAYDAFLKDSTSQGGPGVTELGWKRPVLAGDRLTGSSTVLERRVLNSRPHVGLVTFRHEVTNQRGETIMELVNPILFALRAPHGEQRT